MMRADVRGRHRPDGLEQRLRPSTRATALALVSRAALLVLIIAAGAIGSLPMWSTMWSARIEDAPAAEMVIDARSGVKPQESVPGVEGELTTAEMLAAVDQAVHGVGARLIELELIPAAGTRAEVRMRVDAPGDDASSVARVVEALERAQLDGPSVRTVTPVPAGVRIDVTAVIERASSPLVRPGTDVGRASGTDLSVAITALVQRAGAELRRLEVRDGVGPGDERTVRLGARAGPAQLVEVLAALEREHTAPLRITTWRVEAVGEDLELTATFGHRSMASIVSMTVAP